LKLSLAQSLCALALSLVATAQEPQTRTTIGIEGRVVVAHTGEALVPVEAGEDAVLLLRIGKVEQLADASWRTELRFLARRPGEFDLRASLSFGPGRPVGDAIPAILVQVDSLLPEDHLGDLDGIPGLDGPGAGGFSTIFRAVFALWLIPAIAWLLWRWHNRPRPEPVEVEVVPTLAELLQPLVQGAIAGELDLEGQAKLERLLLGYWRERLGLQAESQAVAVPAMRQHAEAGELLRAVEAWLHRPGNAPADQAEVQSLLARYQGVSAEAQTEDTRA
jgi:hypothetical protein